MFAPGFPDNPTCRLEALSIPRLLDAIGLFADEELAGTELTRVIIIGLDFATIQCFFFLLFHPLRHRFGTANQAEIFGAAERAEMADVEQMKKNVPFITCEISHCQYVSNLVFGVSVPGLDLRVQVNSVKQPIKSNSVGS